MISNTAMQTALQNTSREVDAYVLVNDTVRLESGAALKDFKFNAKIDIDGVWIGSAVPKMLELTLIKSQMSTAIKKGDKLQLFWGIRHNGRMLYQKLTPCYAYSTGEAQSAESKSVKITAYDRLKALQERPLPEPSFPLTVGRLLEIALDGSGIRPLTGRDAAVFSEYVIKQRIHLGSPATCADALRAVAQLGLSAAVIDEYERLRFVRPSGAPNGIDLSCVFVVKRKGEVKPYTAVVVSRMPQEDNVAYIKPGATEDKVEALKVANNPIADLNRPYFAERMLPLLDGIAYEGAEQLRMQANPLIECGDILLVNGSRIAVYEHELTLTRSLIKSVIAAKDETNFKKAAGVEKRLNETILEVDKVKNEITAKIETFGSRVRDVEQRMTDEAITAKVAEIAENKVDQSVATYVEAHKDELAGERGADGAPGRSVVATRYEYAISSDDKPPTVGWSTSIPERDFNGEGALVGTIWQRVDTRYSDGEHEVSEPQAMSSDEIDKVLGQLKALKSRVASAEQKITKDAIVQTVTSSSTWAGLSGEVQATRSKVSELALKDSSLELSIRNKVDVRNAIYRFDDSGVRFLHNGENKLYFNGANGDLVVKGAVEAASGNIGGWRIGQHELYNKEGGACFITTNPAHDSYIYAGPAQGDWNFQVKKDGSIIAKAGTIGGWDIGKTSLMNKTSSSIFLLDVGASSSGYLYAGTDWGKYNFIIGKDGSITASKGLIGGFTLDSWRLYSGSGANHISLRSPAATGVVLLIGGEDWNSANFAVTKSGNLKASGAVIDGTHIGKAQLSSGTYAGSHSGYGNFGSGSFSGNGNFASGMTVGGNAIYADNGGISTSFVGASTVQVRGGMSGLQVISGGVQYSLRNLSIFGRDSDIRLKDGVEDIEDEFLEDIYKLPIISYTLKADPMKRRLVGVNANLVMKTRSDRFARHVIRVDRATGYYAADYTNLIGMLVKAVQNLNKRLMRLEKEL